LRRLFKANWWRERRADAGALACLCLFFVAFFPQGLFGGKYLFVGDGFFYSYPLRTVAWRMLRHGEWPLWTPYIMSGYPLLSMAQLGLAYPLTWGYLFLPGRIAEQVYVLAPFLLAPAFTYAYLRTLRRSPLAALVGALTFGYGGMMASPLANNGLMTNACMWLPLLLVAVERARHRRFVPCLLLGTCAYTMSMLTGVGQGFLYTGLLASAYAGFLAIFAPPRAADAHTDQARTGFADVRRFIPLLVACGSIMLAASVAAFQLFETARAVKRSVRSSLSYDIFTQGAYTPASLWKSLGAPLFYGFDMNAYVPPLALMLMLVAVYTHARHKLMRDPRVFFWLAIALLALVLMLGQHTPLYRLVYYTPLLNRFRVPSRHTFEWTFALGVLAAYGWDAAAVVLRRRREQQQHARTFTLYAALALLAAAIACGALWWLRVQTLPVGVVGAAPAMTVYRLWKGAFVLLILVALWRAALITSARWRACLLMACVLVGCYVEPSALVMRWWGRLGLPASRFAAMSDATRYLAQFPPAENRVFTRVDLMAEQFESRPRLDAANLSALYGLHNVAGYEPLILERYSRALGSVGLDTVRTFAGSVPDPSLFSTRSHVLDILNTVFVVSYPNLNTALGSADETTRLGAPGEVWPQSTKTLGTTPTVADSLELVTLLTHSTFEPDGKVVAQVHIYTTDGRRIDLSLRAGVDTAEWAHERADVRPLVKHKLAPIFDSTQVGGADGYPAYRYKTLLTFVEPLRVRQVDVTNVSQTAHLGIFSAALRNSQTQTSAPLFTLYSQAWQPVYEQNSTLVLRNTRARPRAWLVAEAEAVDGEEALARIRGDSQAEFDPARTVLLEVRPDELPHLPGGTVAPESTAQIKSYEPTRLLIETDAPTATVLVVSEIFYPGWTATVDGQPAQMSVADYLLRGVALPAGRHTVEMRYTAPAARTGAIISGCTLLLLCALFIYGRRTSAGSSTASCSETHKES